MAFVLDALASLTNSGPGWLNDVLGVSVHFDADLEVRSSIPHIAKGGPDGGESALVHHRSLFASGAPVAGFVRITAPAGRTVPHAGVTLRLESGFFALDDIHTRDLYEEEVVAAGPGSVAGTVDVPFLFRGTGRATLLESYEGELFSVRHSVLCVVARPWYTFEVTATVPLAVQRIHDIPRPAREGEGAEGGGVGAAKSVAPAAVTPASAPGADASAAALEAQLALYGPQSLSLKDVIGGGSVTLSYERGW